MVTTPSPGSEGEVQFAICKAGPRLCRRETEGFVWTVRNFSKITDEMVLSEPGCCLGGFQWGLCMFPKGETANLEPDEANKYLSLYLEVLEVCSAGTKLPKRWKCTVAYRLTLLSHRDGVWKALSDAPCADHVHVFSRDDNGWGVACFVPLSRLTDPAEGFLHDDTLQIEARITVQLSAPRAERIEQLHKYVESLHGDEATSDAEVRVGDASFLTHKFVLGQVPFFQTKFASAVGEGAAGQVTRSGASEAAAASASPATRVVATLPSEQVTPSAFKVVLASLYRVSTPPKFPRGLRLLEVHAAARFLLMGVLQRACEAALGEEELSVEELVPFLRYANLHGLADLKEKCFLFATESGAQLGDFMVTEGFAEMVAEDRELYLEFVEHLRSQTVQNSAEKKRKR